MQLNTVIFDMDGVVYDSERLYFMADKLAANQLHIPFFNLNYYKKFLGSSTNCMYNNMVNDCGNAQLVDSFFHIAHNKVINLVKQGYLQFKLGFLDLINFLKSRGIIFGLASSNNLSMINLFLQYSNFQNEFQFIVSAENVKYAKPNPDIFIEAWKKAGTPDKNEVIIIEDSINGIVASNRAGIPVIMVPDYIKPNHFEYSHTLTIQPDLKEVKHFILKKYFL